MQFQKNYSGQLKLKTIKEKMIFKIYIMFQLVRKHEIMNSNKNTTFIKENGIFDNEMWILRTITTLTTFVYITFVSPVSWSTTFAWCYNNNKNYKSPNEIIVWVPALFTSVRRRCEPAEKLLRSNYWNKMDRRFYRSILSVESEIKLHLFAPLSQ